MQKGQFADFPWAPIPGVQLRPVWNGNAFQLGEQTVAVLSYATGDSGWTDELTAFHENNAGSDHVMDRASRGRALEQLRRYLKAPVDTATILEVGCSTGYMLKTIQEGLPGSFLIGADYVLQPLKHLALQKLNVPLLQFDLTKCPLADNCVDAVVLLNVLEHIDDDNAAIAQIARILKPGGIAVIEVPAGPNLFDVYDKQLMHFRRYSMKALRQSIENKDLKVIERSHLGFSLYPAFYMTKKRNQKYLTAPVEEQRKIVQESIRASKSNFALKLLMGVELLAGRWISYPFGIRCVITAQKRA